MCATLPLQGVLKPTACTHKSRLFGNRWLLTPHRRGHPYTAVGSEQLEQLERAAVIGGLRATATTVVRVGHRRAGTPSWSAAARSQANVKCEQGRNDSDNGRNVSLLTPGSSLYLRARMLFPFRRGVSLFGSIKAPA